MVTYTGEYSMIFSRIILYLQTLVKQYDIHPSNAWWTYTGAYSIIFTTVMHDYIHSEYSKISTIGMHDYTFW